MASKSILARVFSILGLVGLVILLSMAGQVRGQCSFDWRPPEVATFIHGSVYSTIAWDPDGPGPQSEQLIVGGSFDKGGSISANNIMSWNGTGWQALGPGFSG